METPLIGIDTETTGLGSGAQAVEVGVCTLQNNRVVQAHSFLVVPSIDIDDGASEVHGLSREVVERYALGRDLGMEILFTLLNQGYPLVGHNIVYDIRCLVSTYGRDAFKEYGDTPVIDTLQEAKRRGHQYGHRKLGTVASSLGINVGDAHTALDDALTAVRVLQKMTGFHEPRSKPLSSYL